MSKEWLKRLRIIIPGIIILILLNPFFVEDLGFKRFFDSFNLMQGFIFIVISSIFGSIYYILNLRKFTIAKPIEEINNNIKNKLIGFCEHCKISSDNCTLKKDKTLMHIFYNLIDNDPSLTQKSKSVMLNGLVLSTVADIIIITIGFTPTYLFAFAFTNKIHFVLAAGITLVITILTWLVFLPKATNSHLSLSNDQLDFIKVHYAEKVRNKLKESCPNYPTSDA